MAHGVGRIRRRATFRALSRPDARASRGPVTVVFSRTEEAVNGPIAGYAVGRRHGGAVRRNRLRRRLREALRSAGPELAAGAYLVRVRPEAAELDFADLQRAVEDAARAACGRTKEPGRTGR